MKLKKNHLKKLYKKKAKVKPRQSSKLVTYVMRPGYSIEGKLRKITN
jgi:hypothetical protein